MTLQYYHQKNISQCLFIKKYMVRITVISDENWVIYLLMHWLMVECGLECQE